MFVLGQLAAALQTSTLHWNAKCVLLAENWLLVRAWAVCLLPQTCASGTIKAPHPTCLTPRNPHHTLNTSPQLLASYHPSPTSSPTHMCLPP